MVSGGGLAHRRPALESSSATGPLDPAITVVVPRRDRLDRTTHRPGQPAPTSLGGVLSGGPPGLRGLDPSVLLGLYHPVPHPGKTGRRGPATLGKIPPHPKAVAAGNGVQTAGNLPERRPVLRLRGCVQAFLSCPERFI